MTYEQARKLDRIALNMKRQQELLFELAAALRNEGKPVPSCYGDLVAASETRRRLFEQLRNKFDQPRIAKQIVDLLRQASDDIERLLFEAGIGVNSETIN